ncbi:MAG: lectin like domain-containing protein [Clostridia bacterium]|nr:lectin like domain-containing protein [Clostridia bacterium]
MSKIISLVISVILWFFPFLNFLPIGAEFPAKLQIITMDEDGNDIILLDENGEAVDEEQFHADSAEEETVTLPQKYDARDDGIVTPVKAQGNTGCCWAFAAISAAETNMIKNGLADSSVDYSEAHLVWFGLRSRAECETDPTFGDGIFTENPFTDGGNWCRSVFTLARWSGAELEKNAPFDGIPFIKVSYPEEKRYNSSAHLQNSKYIPADDMNGIKEAILDCGSITASYYHSGTFLNYNDKGEACYFQKSVKNTNHTVVIVGWDDNFSKDNFIRTPAGDGAWLVKNSWGTKNDDSGYLWLSYHDTSLSYFVTFEMESADNYENINQYDGFGYKGWAYVDGCDTMSMANVFETKDRETLKAVSFHTVQQNVNYAVEIYTDVPADGNPTDGALASTQSGFMKYRGYKTVPLSDTVSMNKNTRYSVVVTIQSAVGADACIPLEYPTGFDGAHIRSYHGEVGQSYFTIRRNFDEWQDSAKQGYNNVCIKAFTDNDDFCLKDSSTYEIRHNILTNVIVDDSDDFILSQFKNRHISIKNDSVYLLDKNGKIKNSMPVARLGDIDNDGNIDFDDYELLMLFEAGVVKPTDIEKASADFNSDWRITEDDAVAFTMILYMREKL